uniref:FAD-binding and (Fe-S)-binding domain-containing protein n=1 Tax=Marinobacterium profundum TaxID=1714300 RepID=UPI00082961A2|nr:FAD-binding and (Fe-S)-binding domain-containing protein [Marinobacterium profundum]
MNSRDSTAVVDAKYIDLRTCLSEKIDQQRLIDDPLRLLAYGTDASFYRLIPRLVVRPETEVEVQAVLGACHQFQAPVTFRAAGTSLSGQAVTDSVLVQLKSGWTDYTLLEGGNAITLQPGVIGGRANQVLAPFGRKIGPDPASINSCMIGGIFANNASGMCCGTAQNSYNTVRDIRIILADGTLLDTADDENVRSFRQTHRELLDKLETLADDTRANHKLAEKIRHKYRLKNTTGYSLNSLVDYADGIEILKHLMVGSEGTLGFISSVTYNTVVDEPLKAASLVIFSDIMTACEATTALKTMPVAAVELMDRAALRSVEDLPGMACLLRGLPDTAAALLIDIRADETAILDMRIAEVEALLARFETLTAPEFTTEKDTYTLYWKIRKGLFPAVGAVRAVGTTVIIEDVAFPIEQLACGVLDLLEVLKRHGYGNAILFGHALEGNLHFVFPQGFELKDEVRRYKSLMDDVTQLVAVGYGGSLKAEHGTGRNMAPFVELEWGQEAYELMWTIKSIFDPANLLNPDVILTSNKSLHIENLKPLPESDEIIDKCIECGFCESVCPSRNFTVTPRQRIVIHREIARLRNKGAGKTEAEKERLTLLEDGYNFQGIDSCAADGLCSTECPVGINTGDLMRKLRHNEHLAYGAMDEKVGRNFARVTSVARGVLRTAGFASHALGDTLLAGITAKAARLSSGKVPVWTPSVPKAMPVKMVRTVTHYCSSVDEHIGPVVVYFPSCSSRVFGASRGDQEERSLTEITLSLLSKAGFRVIIPESVHGLCCGMPFQSKGGFREAERKGEELKAELLSVSENGRHPVLFDTSPCTMRMRQEFSTELEIMEPVEFAHRYLLPKLKITPVNERIAVHVTCSSTRMGLADKCVALAKACANEVVVPADVTCCGFAGDKGFTLPDLNRSALASLAREVEGCQSGYSNSRTCEIGLAEHSGIPYRSIFSLLDRTSEAIIIAP